MDIPYMEHMGYGIFTHNLPTSIPYKSTILVGKIYIMDGMGLKNAWHITVTFWIK